MKKAWRVLLILCTAGNLVGCSQVPVVYTISTGSYIRLSDEELSKQRKQPRGKFVIWGNNQGALNGAIEVIEEHGHSVVERARIQEIFDEQRITLTHAADDSNLLKAGRIVGADVAVFVQVTERTESITPSRGTMFAVFSGLAAANPQYVQPPPPNPVTVYRPVVTVRAVRIETGEIVWSGRSTVTLGINDPDLTVMILTRAAMLRAYCPVREGAEWVEYASDGSRQPWGCIKR